MRLIFLRIIKALLLLALILIGLYFFLAIEKSPKEIDYGMSFNTFYAGELGLDWKETYDAIIDDLGVKHLRLAAHWTMIEPQKDVFNFAELDYQMDKAKENDADVILAVGRRLPRWPECHIPAWAADDEWSLKKEEIKTYIKAVVERYRGYDNIKYWQVENEPFLGVFADEHCGPLDEDFLKEEIALVKELDPGREVLVTDSGNLGLWYKPYSLGDAFGTSLYVYLWNPELGKIKSILPASWYTVRKNLLGYIYGKKDTLLIELSAEPWLTQPIASTTLEVQFDRMDIDKFEEVIKTARKTKFSQQYLWGAEWWYYLKKQGHPEFWNMGKTLY